MISHLQLASEKQAKSHSTYQPLEEETRAVCLCLWESRCEDCVEGHLSAIRGVLVLWSPLVAGERVQFDSDYSVEDGASSFSFEVSDLSIFLKKDTTNLQSRRERFSMAAAIEMTSKEEPTSHMRKQALKFR